MSDVELGMPTLIELPDLQANIGLCRELGLSFVELNMNCPAYCLQALPAEQLRRLSEDNRIAFTLHLPEALDLASFQPAIRNGHVACCKDAIGWAGDAGIALVNLHLNSGVYFSLPDRKVWLYEKYKEDFLARLEGAFGDLLELARAHGLTLCIENAGNFALGFIGDALDRLLAVDDERLRLTWDVGHDAGAGFSDRPVFDEFQGRIGHMHLHDSNGKQDHQVLFTGQVNVPAMLALARRLGIGVVIETKTVESLVESVRQIDERRLR